VAVFSPLPGTWQGAPCLFRDFIRAGKQEVVRGTAGSENPGQSVLALK